MPALHVSSWRIPPGTPFNRVYFSLKSSGHDSQTGPRPYAEFKDFRSDFFVFIRSVCEKWFRLLLDRIIFVFGVLVLAFVIARSANNWSLDSYLVILGFNPQRFPTRLLHAIRSLVAFRLTWKVQHNPEKEKLLRSQPPPIERNQYLHHLRVKFEIKWKLSTPSTTSQRLLC